MESNIQTKKYLQRELSSLEQGNWPTSTKGGELVSLSWSWEIKDALLNIDLVDVSGQDVRRELSDESITDLKIVENIQKASIVFLAIDLQGHYDEVSKDTKSENAWIVENILKKMRPEQSLYVIVTKADLLHRFLKNDEDYHNEEILLNMIENLMPEFSLQGALSLLEKDNCKIFAVSSVETVSVDDEDQSRVPKVPLQSKGFDELVKSIFDFVSAKSEKEKLDLEIAKIKESTNEIIKKGMPYIKKIALIAGAIVVLFLIGTQVRNWVKDVEEKNKAKAEEFKIEQAEKKRKSEEEAQKESARIAQEKIDTEEARKEDVRRYNEELVECNYGFHRKEDGRLSCTHCKGLGHMSDWGYLSWGNTKCPKCDGEKTVLCPKCNGGIKIKRKDL